MSRLDKPRQQYFLGDVVDFFTGAADKYNEYKGLIDTAVGIGKGYLDYKDAKRRNELEEAAYDDYLAAAEADADVNDPNTATQKEHLRRDVHIKVASLGLGAESGDL